MKDIKVRIFNIPVFRYKERGDKRIFKLLGIKFLQLDGFKPFVKGLISAVGSRGSLVFISRHNIGETTIYLALLREWIRENKENNPLIIIPRSSHLSLFSLFFEEMDNILYYPLSQSQLNTFFKESKTIYEGISFFCPTYKIAEEMVMQHRAGTNVNFIDYCTESMHLKRNIYSLPSVPLNVSKKAENIISDLGIKNDFIMLFPEAVSLKELDKNFWNSLVDTFIEKGYSVIINSKSSDYWSRSDVFYIFEDIATTYSLASKSYGFVSMASGLSVLLSLSGVKGVVIYSEFDNKHLDYSLRELQTIYTTVGLKKLNAPINVCECLISDSDLNEKILNYF